MKVQKVIKCRVVHLTNIKHRLLSQEYVNLQRFLRGENLNVKLYSANKQQAKRFYKRVKPDKEYPLSIRKDLIRVKHKNTRIAEYWARTPVAGKRGGIWVAIRPHQKIPEDVEICESKLMRKDAVFFLNLTIQKEVEINPPSDPSRTAVIACDIGEANPIASVAWWDAKVQEANFGAPEVRGIRAHYNQIRKEIGRKKAKHAVQVIKKIGNSEHRKVLDRLHKATRSIVDKAKELRNKGYQVVIVVGDLEKVRRPHKKYQMRCRKNNRKVHSMPSLQVKQQIEYKALWKGIPVEFVDEAYTSKLCFRCGSIGERHKRQFLCLSCGLDYNADLNGAKNILNRFLGYKLRNRAAPAVCDRSKMGSEPAPILHSVQRLR